MANWLQELKEALTSVHELEGEGFAFYEARKTAGLTGVEERFRTLVPRYYSGLIDKCDPEDPIAKMAFPAEAELASGADALRDPIGDLERKAAPRLTHRYKDRALLHVTNLCPMYCRFCFRKNLMNEREEALYAGEFTEAFRYLAEHPEIEELILTGGDPWMLADTKLSALVDEIASRAPGVKVLRFHTRMPVTLPSRVTDDLLRAVVRETRFQTVVVTHFNHPREMTREAREAVECLRNGGVMVLNQSVLLKGVNDSVETLRALFRGLGGMGVLPYYLHHCDLVRGAEHFRLPLSRGQEIWRDLRGELPGYLLPEYILDIPGGHGKIPVVGEFVESLGGGRYLLHRHGKKFEYRDPGV